MPEIAVRFNGIDPNVVVTEWETETAGGTGQRKAILGGWGKSEIGARQQLLEQAKAMRDELNSEIEQMIAELASGIR